MAKRVQFVRHETAAAAAFTGLEGEVTVDLGSKTARIHDGITPGGKVLALADEIIGVLTAANNLSDVADALVAATNLGLGVLDLVTFDHLNLTDGLMVNKTATEVGEHGIELDVNTVGFSDVKALGIAYDVDGLAAGRDDVAINLSINKTASTGGRVLGVNVEATDGASQVIAVRSGIDVDPIHQASGAFANPTFASNNTTATDVSTMRDGSNGTTNGIMVAVNDYIIIGAASAFSELEIDLTGISSKNILPEFYYSIAGTNQFTQFFPIDSTDGMLHTGVISWDITTFTGHVADGVTGTFNIKIVRTRTSAITNPILGHAESGLVVPYEWDKDGNLTINNIQAGDDVRIGANFPIKTHYAFNVLELLGKSGIITASIGGNNLILASNLYQDAAGAFRHVNTGGGVYLNLNGTNLSINVAVSAAADAAAAIVTPIIIDTATGNVAINKPAHAGVITEVPPLTAGTTTAYTATVGITSYAIGTVYRVRWHGTNETGTATIALDGLAAITLDNPKSWNGGLVLRDIFIGEIAELYYNGTTMEVINPHTFFGSYNPTINPTASFFTLNTAEDTLSYRYADGLCRVQGKIGIASVGSPTGLFTLSLPRAVASLAETSDALRFFVGYEGLGTAAALGLVGEIDFSVSSSQARVYEQTATGTANTSANRVVAATKLFFSFEYPSE